MTSTTLSKSKTRRLLWGVCGLLLVCFAITVITSCADDSSYEARLEEARMAIDDRDYDRAILLLNELKAEYPDDPLILQYLSNAYAGLAGLDTFDLLTVIDQLIENESSGSIDMVGTVLGDVTGLIEVGEINGILSNIENAIDNLENIQGISPLTDDQNVQLGLLSLNRAGITIAAMVAEEQGLTRSLSDNSRLQKIIHVKIETG
jgi:hypothetical protein